MLDEKKIIEALRAATDAEVSPLTDETILAAARGKAEEMKSRRATPLARRTMLRVTAVAATLVLAFGVTLAASPQFARSVFDAFFGSNAESPEGTAREHDNIMKEGIGAGPSGSGAGGLTPPNDAKYEFLAKGASEHPFIDTDDENVSTFAIDTDTGAYSICRRYIMEGLLPPSEAARIEEFVNYLDYGYAAPKTGALALYVDGAPSRFNLYGKDDVYKIVRIGLKAAERERSPAKIVFVVDTSASMAVDGKMALLKKSLETLLENLGPNDKVAIVTFAGNAKVALGPTAAKDAERIMAAIDALIPETGDDATDIGAGMKAACKVANVYGERERTFHSRIVLISDGMANLGDTGPGSILQSLSKAAGTAGAQIFTVGVGLDGYNDFLMERLADHGNGRYVFVDSPIEAQRVFGEDLGEMLGTAARDVTVAVEFNPAIVRRYRLIGYENRRIDEDAVGGMGGGEIGDGGEMTALYEIKLQPDAAEGRLATVRVAYTEPRTGRRAELRKDIAAEAVAKSFETADGGLRRAMCAAEFAAVLRGSCWSNTQKPEEKIASLRAVIAGIQTLGDSGEDAKLAELYNLIRRTMETLKSKSE